MKIEKRTPAESNVVRELFLSDVSALAPEGFVFAGRTKEGMLFSDGVGYVAVKVIVKALNFDAEDAMEEYAESVAKAEAKAQEKAEKAAKREAEKAKKEKEEE